MKAKLLKKIRKRVQMKIVSKKWIEANRSYVAHYSYEYAFLSDNGRYGTYNAFNAFIIDAANSVGVYGIHEVIESRKRRRLNRYRQRLAAKRRLEFEREYFS